MIELKQRIVGDASADVRMSCVILLSDIAINNSRVAEKEQPRWRTLIIWRIRMRAVIIHCPTVPNTDIFTASDKGVGTVFREWKLAF